MSEQTLASADFLSRLAGRRYWAGNFEVGAVAAVAVRSRVGGSWAAYIGGVPTMEPETDEQAERVYRLGVKLDEVTARAMFLDVTGEYRA